MISRNYKVVTNEFLKNIEVNKINEIRYYEGVALLVICYFDSLKDLLISFEHIKHETAAHIQGKLSEHNYSDSLRWNLYLIFVINKKIENEYISEIQKIESDKYCCKKYILQLEDIEDLNSELVKKIPLFIDLKALHEEVAVVNNNLDITKLEISEILKKKIISKNIEEFVSKDYSIAEIENLYSEEINIEN